MFVLRLMDAMKLPQSLEFILEKKQIVLSSFKCVFYIEISFYKSWLIKIWIIISTKKMKSFEFKFSIIILVIAISFRARVANGFCFKGLYDSIMFFF